MGSSSVPGVGLAFDARGFKAGRGVVMFRRMREPFLDGIGDPCKDAGTALVLRDSPDKQ